MREGQREVKESRMKGRKVTQFGYLFTSHIVVIALVAVAADQ